MIKGFFRKTLSSVSALGVFSTAYTVAKKILPSFMTLNNQTTVAAGSAGPLALGSYELVYQALCGDDKELCCGSTCCINCCAPIKEKQLNHRCVEVTNKILLASSFSVLATMGESAIESYVLPLLGNFTGWTWAGIFNPYGVAFAIGGLALYYAYTKSKDLRCCLPVCGAPSDRTNFVELGASTGSLIGTYIAQQYVEFELANLGWTRWAPIVGVFAIAKAGQKFGEWYCRGVVPHEPDTHYNTYNCCNCGDRSSPQQPVQPVIVVVGANGEPLSPELQRLLLQQPLLHVAADNTKPPGIPRSGTVEFNGSPPPPENMGDAPITTASASESEPEETKKSKKSKSKKKSGPTESKDIPNSGKQVTPAAPVLAGHHNSLLSNGVPTLAASINPTAHTTAARPAQPSAGKTKTSSEKSTEADKKRAEKVKAALQQHGTPISQAVIPGNTTGAPAKKATIA